VIEPALENIWLVTPPCRINAGMLANGAFAEVTTLQQCRTADYCKSKMPNIDHSDALAESFDTS
jgi:hypothetical protein